MQSSVGVNMFIINLLPCLQKAMDVIGISDDDQASVLQIVAGVLHLGNISFIEQGNYAVPSDDECMYFSSFSICKSQQVFIFLLVGCCTYVTYQLIRSRRQRNSVLQLVIQATCSLHVLAQESF